MFIADEHPDALAGREHALGEFGGVTQWIAGRSLLFRSRVAEKQLCSLRAHVRGTGGHGALGVKGGAMRKLGDILPDARPPAAARATSSPLVRDWFEQDGGRAAARPQSLILQRIARSEEPADLAALALGKRGRQLSRVIRNTVSPTNSSTAATRSTSSERHRAPARRAAAAGLHARGPDRRAARARREGHRVRGHPARSPGPPDPDLSFYEPLAQIIRELDPGSIPVPMLQAGVTDARHLSRAGLQTYGWLPLQLPEDFEMYPLIHNADRARSRRRTRVRRRCDRPGDRSGTPREAARPRRHEVPGPPRGRRRALGRTRGDDLHARQTNPELFPEAEHLEVATATGRSTRSPG